MLLSLRGMGLIPKSSEEGSSKGSVQGSVKGSAQGYVKGSVQGSAKGSVQGSAKGSAVGSAGQGSEKKTGGGLFAGLAARKAKRLADEEIKKQAAERQEELSKAPVEVSIKEFWKICSNGRVDDLRYKILWRLQAGDPHERVNYKDAAVRKAIMEKDASDHYRSAWLKVVARGNLDCVKELMAYAQPEQTINREVDSQGFNGLLICCKHGYLDIAKYLVTQCEMSTDVDHKTRAGDNCLTLAAKSKQNSKELMELLVEHGCDANVRNAHGKTAALIATENGKAECLNVLLHHRKDVIKDLPNHRLLYRQAVEAAQALAVAEAKAGKKIKTVTTSPEGVVSTRIGQTGPVSVQKSVSKVNFYCRVLHLSNEAEPKAKNGLLDFFDSIVALEEAEARKDDWKKVEEHYRHKLEKMLKQGKKDAAYATGEEAGAIKHEIHQRLLEANKLWARLHSHHQEKRERYERVLSRIIDLDETDLDNRTIVYLSCKLPSEKCFNAIIQAITEDCRVQRDKEIEEADAQMGQACRVMMLESEAEAAAKAGLDFFKNSKQAKAAEAAKAKEEEKQRKAEAKVKEKAEKAVWGKSSSKSGKAPATPSSSAKDGAGAEAGAEGEEGAEAGAEESPSTKASREAAEKEKENENAKLLASSFAHDKMLSDHHYVVALKTYQSRLAKAKNDEIRKELDNVAQRLSIPTKPGFTCLSLCAVYGHRSRLEMLLKHNALFKPDKDGRYPLHLALAWEQVPIPSDPAKTVPNACIEPLVAAALKDAEKSKAAWWRAGMSSSEVLGQFSRCAKAEDVFRRTLEEAARTLQGSPRDVQRSFPGLLYYFKNDFERNVDGSVRALCKSLAKYFFLPNDERTKLAPQETILEICHVAGVYINNYYNLGAAKNLHSEDTIDPSVLLSSAVSSTADAAASVVSFMNPLNLVPAKADFDPHHGAKNSHETDRLDMVVHIICVAAAAVLGGNEANFRLSPLQWAAQCGHVKCVQGLLAQPGMTGKPVPVRVSCPLINLLMTEHLFLQAAMHNDISSIKTFLGTSELNVNAVAHDGSTALIFAAARGYVDIVKLLLSDPRVHIHRRDLEGLSALFCACRGDYGNFLLYWLEAQVDLDMLNLILRSFSIRRPGAVRTKWRSAFDKSSSSSSGGGGAEEKAGESEKDSREVMLVLMTGDEKERLNSFLRIPLIIPGFSVPIDFFKALEGLAEQGQLSSVSLPIRPDTLREFQKMLSQRIFQDVVAATGEAGSTEAVSSSSLYGYTHIAQMLLDHPKMTSELINSRDCLGMTPLFLACINNNVAIAAMLLKEPDVDVNLADNDDDTPLIAAAGRGNVGCVQLLLSHPSIDVNRAGNYGNTSNSGGGSARTELFKRLAEGGGRQALLREQHKARQIRRKSMPVLSTEFFLESFSILGETVVPPSTGSDEYNARNTALLVAAANGHIRIVRLLLQHPLIDVNRLNTDGYTPAGLAKSEEIRMMLYEFGTNVSAEDRLQLRKIHRRTVVCALEGMTANQPRKPGEVLETKDQFVRFLRNIVVSRKNHSGLVGPPSPANIFKTSDGTEMVVENFIECADQVDQLRALLEAEPLSASSAWIDDGPAWHPIKLETLEALEGKLSHYAWFVDRPNTWQDTQKAAAGACEGVFGTNNVKTPQTLLSLPARDALFFSIRYRLDQTIHSTMLSACPYRPMEVLAAAAQDSSLTVYPSVFFVRSADAASAQRNAPAIRALRAAVSFLQSEEVWGEAWAKLDECSRNDLELGERFCLCLSVNLSASSAASAAGQEEHNSHHHTELPPHNIPYENLTRPFLSLWGLESDVAAPVGGKAEPAKENDDCPAQFISLVRSFCKRVEAQAGKVLEAREKEAKLPPLPPSGPSGEPRDSVAHVALRLRRLEEAAYKASIVSRPRASSRGLWG